MQEFEDFLGTIHFPPNPFRNLDNTLSDDLPLLGHYTTGRFDEAGEPLPNGDAVQGLLDYRTAGLDLVECVTCHTLPTGLGRDTEVTVTFSPTPPFIVTTIEDIPIGPNGEHHLAITGLDISDGTPIKIPSLRNLYERVGFETTQLENTAGFGFLHDGSVDSIARFVSEPVFALTSVQQVADMVAFMLSFSGGDLPEGEDVFPFTEPVGPGGQHSHAAVGIQVTLDPDSRDDDDLLDRYELMRELADEDAVGLVARGIVDGVARGYTFTDDGAFQSDREDDQVQWDDLVDELVEGDVLTFTVVPKGTEERIGIDRDGDGAFNGDELDSCSDPEDPDSLPGPGCDGREFVRGDVNGDGNTDLSDPVRLLIYLFAEGSELACEDAADVNDDGDLGLGDAIFELAFLFQEGTAPGEPTSDCGSDPTFDTVECASYPECE